jgi:PAS domain S-box-containing protein/putative nucleotidyltransferase with HDIG domain
VRHDGQKPGAAKPDHATQGRAAGGSPARRSTGDYESELCRLRNQGEHYRELFEKSPIGIYRTTPDGRILLANASLLELMGFSTFEELAARNLEQSGFENQQTRQRFKALMEQDGQVRGFESAWVRKDGTIIHIREHAKAVRDEAGAIVFYEGTIENVTDRVRAERELAGSLKRLSQTFDEAIEALATAVEKRDPYTGGHQKRVAALAAAIANDLGCEPEVTRAVRMAAIMHDVGKIYVPAEILARPGRLTAVEMEIIKLHSAMGFEILRGISFDQPIAEIVLQHHEKLDGSGYPRGIRGEAIRQEARIIAVADIMEALSSHRPYRPAYGPHVALEVLAKEKGEKLDPRVVTSCVDLFVRQGFAF